MKKGTIILTGGGTAGHVSPNITLLPELKKHFEKIIYIGSKNGIEKKLISEQTDIEYKQISTVKFVRKNIFKNLLLPFKLSRAISEAKQILKKENPCIVFSKGGYVGLPVVIAASKLKIPVICHESDLSLGLANKIAKKYATVICTNFEITAKQNGPKCICTGTPLKQNKMTKQQAKEKMKIETDKPILLITGGSLGAKSINDFIFENIDMLSKKFFVIHLVGKGNLNTKIKIKDYKQIEFSNDMWTLFALTDYSISRAGANTIYELLSNNIPTIFIPLPKGVSRGDQVENAKYLFSLGVSKTILQENLTREAFLKELDDLQKNANLIKNNIKKHNFSSGTEKIMQQILKYKKED